MDLDTVMLNVVAAADSIEYNFVLAIDFGTTFSSVAYFNTTHLNQRSRIGLQQVQTIKRYPFNRFPNFSRPAIPTELWYSARTAIQHHSQNDHSTLEVNHDDNIETDTASDSASEVHTEAKMPFSSCLKRFLQSKIELSRYVCRAAAN